MFGVLNNQIQLSNSDLYLPTSRLVLNSTITNSQIHIRQLDTSTASGICFEGSDNKSFNVSYNGTGLTFNEDGAQQMILQNGGRVGIGVSNPAAGLHIANDLRVDGNFTVNGSFTKINTVATLTHSLEVDNSGTSPAVTIRQTGAMPTLEVYDDTVQVLKIADGGFMGINNSNPQDWLDVIGDINSSGAQKSAWQYARSAPATGTNSMISPSGAYLAWNRSGTDGYTLFANQRGSLSGGWEFVSYSAAGAFNKIAFNISDAGDLYSFGNFASLTGNISIGSNSFFKGTMTNFANVISSGPSNNSSGPHYYAYFSGDSYPAYQRLIWAHDNISSNFDSFYDGSNWKYSSSSNAFQIAKLNGHLYIRPSVSSGTWTTGDVLSWNTSGINVAPGGMVGINTFPVRMFDVGGDVNVGTDLYVAGTSSLTGNLSCSSTISGTALSVTGNFCSIAGNLNVATSVAVGSLLNVQLLNVTGAYATIAGALSIGTFLNVVGSQTIAGNLSIGTSLFIAANCTVNTSLTVGSSFSVGTNSLLGGATSITGNLSVGTNATISGYVFVGSDVIVGSSIIANSDLKIFGQSTFLGNVAISGSATVSGNLNVISQTSLSGNIYVGSSATITGNLRVGTSLSVGSIVTCTALNVSGPYASVSGNLWVGTDVIIKNNATISGTINSFGGLFVGATAVIDSTGSILTGVSGTSGAVNSSTVTAQVANVTDFANISSLTVGTDASIQRNVSVGQTLTVTNLNVSGKYASVSGLLVNNVLGSLLLRGYDESGTYKNISLSAGQSLPAPFIARPIASSQLSMINLNAASIGTLTSQYSLRVTGYLQPPADGTYTFKFTYKDALTCWIGPNKLVDSWTSLAASTITSSNLVLRQGMWTPIILEHVCATPTEKLVMEYSINSSGSYAVVSHAADGSNFQLAYEISDTAPVLLGTTYISGKSFFNDEAILLAGASLPNAAFFSGNLSELTNDAGFLKNTPSTLTALGLNISNFASVSGTVSAAAASLTRDAFIGGSLIVMQTSQLNGIVDIYSTSSAGQLRISPGISSGEASIGFFRNTARGTMTAGDLWSVGNQLAGLTNGNFMITTGSASILTLTPTGSIGINKTVPSATLDVTGTANFTGYLNVGGAFSMTGAIGSGNMYTSNAIFAAGGVFVGTASSINPANLLPGIDNKSSCGTLTARWTSMYSYGLDVSGNSLVTGTMTIGSTNISQYMTSSPLTITPTNPDKPAINPDAYNSLLIYEDCSGTILNSGSLSGAATYGVTSYSTQNCVQLTSTTPNSSGAVTWALNPGNSWVLSAETYAGGGNGAESISFFVYSSTANNITSGYSFVCDEYSNINNGNTSKQFAINYNGSVLASVNGTANGGTFLIPLAAWNSLKIIFLRNNIRFYFNNNLVLNLKDSNRVISGNNTFYCGFVGSCTANHNYHAVRNVKLSKYCPSVWEYTSNTSSDICFPAGNVGIGTISPAYSLDVAGTIHSAALIIDTTLASSVLSVTNGTNSLYLYPGFGSTYSGGSITFLDSSAYSNTLTKRALGINAFGGNVGINNTSPQFQLDVGGSAKISGSLTVGSVLFNSITGTFANIATVTCGSIGATLSNLTTITSSFASISTLYASTFSYGVGAGGAFPNTTSFYAATITTGSFAGTFCSISSLTVGNIAVSAWISPGLSNGWSRYGSGFAPAGYLLDPMGFVHLRGLIGGGTSVIFNLPAGYRPAYNMIFPVVTNNHVFGDIQISASDGSVTPITYSSTWICLDAILFSILA